MKIIVRPYYKGKGFGNIIWQKKYPMVGGQFPEGHPVGSGRADDMQLGLSEGMAMFRQRGYWASCFPEGDGICFKPCNEQTHEQTLIDIAECFGWEISDE